MVRELRKAFGQPRHGLVLANGGVLTHEYVVVLSSRPQKNHSPYPAEFHHKTDWYTPPFDEKAEGEANIEVCIFACCEISKLIWVQTYTVEFNRDGSAKLGHVVGRLKSNGHRFIANHGDEGTLKQLSGRSKELVGRNGWVKPADGRNVFYFERGEKL